MKTIGVLGGMGPEATAYFFGQLIRHAEAGKDQEHPPVIICSLPQIPDRTEAILAGGPSPLPLLEEGLRALARAGADFAVMPCVSVHYFFRDVAPRSPVPLIHLLEETVQAVKKLRPPIRKVGVLATTGTVRSRILHDVFGPAGIELVVPDDREQGRVMRAIYGRNGIKAGRTAGASRDILLDAARGLLRRGARAILAGCTEIPLAVGEGDFPVPFIEPLGIGAVTCLRKAGAGVRCPEVGSDVKKPAQSASRKKSEHKRMAPQRRPA